MAGDAVGRGERLGIVSNDFGGDSPSYHPHFEIKQSVLIDDQLTMAHVPPYATLVDAYQRLLAGPERAFDPPPG